MVKNIPPRVFRIQRRFPSLQRYGLAVEYFPCYSNSYTGQHSVDVVLVSVMLRGRGRHLMDNEERQEEGGSVSVTHYGQKHALITEPPGMEIYNVYLDLRRHPLPVLPESLRPVLSTILPIHPQFQHQLNRRVWIRYNRPQDLAVNLARIMKEMDSTRPGALEIVQHNFQIFLIDVCRAARRHGLVASPTQPVPGWLESIRYEIDHKFTAPHDLHTLAQRARISVPYLCRVFRHYTGKTVIEYLIERRIQAAVWKLREGDEKIISIALSCGFNDIAYFNRVFKRIMAKTPSQYRKTLRRNSND